MLVLNVGIDSFRLPFRPLGDLLSVGILQFGVLLHDPLLGHRNLGIH